MSRNYVCNGTNICACGKCPCLVNHYKKLFTQYPDLMINRVEGNKMYERPEEVERMKRLCGIPPSNK